MNIVNKDGKTNRQHLEGAARMGRTVQGLEGPEMPEELRYLWEWSQTLHGQSGFTMAGIAPLTYTTIADWSRLTDTDIAPHEVDALMMLDRVLLNPSEKEQ